MGKDITSRMSELLREQNMTQRDLASAAGITESAVSHYMNGDRVPRGVNLAKVASALGTTTDYLLGEDDMLGQKDGFKVVKTLIARNASKMTDKEKMALIKILTSDD